MDSPHMGFGVTMYALLLRTALTTSLICLAPLIYATSASAADPLLKVLNSDQLTDVTKAAQKLQSKNKTSFFDPQTNYGSLFGNNKEKVGERVIGWLSESLTQYSPETLEALYEQEYLQVTATFERNLPVPVGVSVVIPHPRYSTAAEYGLLQATKLLIPNKSQVASYEEIYIHDKATTLYYLKDGGCLIHQRLERSTTLSLFSRECAKLTKILDFANALDIPRLNRKLNS